MRTTIYKAGMALLGAGGGALGTAMLDGNLTVPEAVAAVGAGIIAGVGTWWLPYQVEGRHEAS